MRSFILTVALAAMLASCKNENTVKAGDQPFFIFDQVDHYVTDVSDAKVEELYTNQEKNRKDMAMLQIVSGNVPVNAADTLFIKNMDILGFKKQKLDAKHNAELSTIFSLRDANDEALATTCEPVYRDVLVFRQKGKVTGVAKICFDCRDSQIVGSRYNPGTFGQHDEFDRLGKLLNSK